MSSVAGHGHATGIQIICRVYVGYNLCPGGMTVASHCSLEIEF